MNRRLRQGALLAAILMIAALPALLGAAPLRIDPGLRVDMKVLLLTASGNEAGFAAWKANLDRDGIPYDAIVADTAPPLTDATFTDGPGHGRYQAIILTDGDLVHADSTPALAQSEWDALARYESTYGIRQFSDATLPGPAHGLNFATNVGEQGGNTGQLTAAGHQLFPELVGPVPIDQGSFGAQATPLDPANFTTLLTGPGGSSYLGIYTHPEDGRQEMVMTVSSNQFQTQNQLLREGIINWVTRGVHLGVDRNYFSVDVDDVFNTDAKWDPTTHTTPGDLEPTTCGNAGQPACVDLRMTPADTVAAIAWEQANGLTFNLVYNGGAVQDARDAAGGVDPLSDDPTNGLLRPDVISKFRWVNHTFTHLQLDTATQAQIQSEITQNVQFAQANGIPINPQELVTGEHSGLGSYVSLGRPGLNPAMPAALTNTGVTWVADDASVQNAQRAIGPALTVPRHPSNVYYNVATRDDQLNEYNWIYLPPPLGACVNTAVTTCRTTAATWTDYLDSEVGIMFDHVLGNDPRPHYVHQSNLILTSGNGILYGADHQGVLDVLLARYHAYFNATAPLVQPSMSQAGTLLRQQSAWATAAPTVTAYLQDGQAHVTTAGAVDVPLTGTTVGDVYAGRHSGWTTVNGSATFTPADPTSTSSPSLSGDAVNGGTLTATPGAWTGTAPIDVVLRWQRCSADGTSCAVVQDANGDLSGSTYTVGAADQGFRLRVVELAGNPVSSVSQAASSLTAVVPGPPLPPGSTPPGSTTPAGQPASGTPGVPGLVDVIPNAQASGSRPAGGTAAQPGTAGAVAGATSRSPLRLTKLRMLPTRFGVRHVEAGRLRRPLGSLVTWRLDRKGTTRFVVQQRTKKGWRAIGAVSRPSRAGANAWQFSGVVGGRKLALGRYRLVARATAAGLPAGATQTMGFTVVRA
ncbi:MAG TPA: hypothetical protein VKD47_01590 [Miltoncostaeaceae bacterium]|nr:hypothetical protein [Miltoncostaeaceae bacterium]